MRDIKFRTHDKRSGAIEYVDLKDLADGATFDIKYENYDWMEYTGLKDKQDKEIYEGDIVKDCSDSDLIFPVKWSDYWCGYQMPEEFDEEASYPLDHVLLEVIGNIYENPELLTGTKDA